MEGADNNRNLVIGLCQCWDPNDSLWIQVRGRASNISPAGTAKTTAQSKLPSSISEQGEPGGWQGLSSRRPRMAMMMVGLPEYLLQYKSSVGTLFSQSWQQSCLIRSYLAGPGLWPLLLPFLELSTTHSWFGCL